MYDHLPDPDWYLDHVLVHADPAGPPPARFTGPRPAAAWRAWWNNRDVDPRCSLAPQQGFVMSSAQLAVCGVTRSAVRHAVATGRWVSLGRGMVGLVDPRSGVEVAAATVTRRCHALAAAAACERRRDHVVSGRSAAILHGLPTVRVPDLAQLTDAEPTGNGRRNRSHIRPATLRIEEVATWFGVPVTTPARTLVDLARHDRRDAIMAADAALSEGLATVRGIESALADTVGWPGVRQAREVLALADPRSESPLESILRLAMHDDGFAAPALQYEIGPFRVDLALLTDRLVIEADGREKYRGDSGWREKRREHYLRSRDWRVERVLWTDVTRDWATTRLRLRAALRPSWRL